MFGTPSGQIGSIEGGGFCAPGGYAIYNSTIGASPLFAMNCNTGVNDYNSPDLGSIISNIESNNPGGLEIDIRPGLYAHSTAITVNVVGVTIHCSDYGVTIQGSTTINIAQGLDGIFNCIINYTGTGTAISAVNVNNMILQDIRLEPLAAAKVGLELDGITNSRIVHYQSCVPTCTGSFVHDINLNGTAAQASIFNEFDGVVTSFPVFIGQQSGGTLSANSNTFTNCRFTAQLTIGNAALGDAPTSNVFFGGGIQTLPISGSVIPLINSGSGTIMSGVDCEQNNKCAQNGVVGSAGLAQARLIIEGGFWTGTGGSDGQGFGVVETAGAGPIRIINMRGITMALGLPSDTTVSAGASVWTYTNGDASPEMLMLNTVGGITLWTCVGQNIATSQNSSCWLNPNQSMSVTWATNAPAFTKEFV